MSTIAPASIAPETDAFIDRCYSILDGLVARDDNNIVTVAFATLTDFIAAHHGYANIGPDDVRLILAAFHSALNLADDAATLTL